jgi:DNA recombination protein RmuC
VDATLVVTLCVICGVVGATLGLVLGRYAWPTTHGIDPDIYNATQSEATRSAEQARNAGEEVARLTERVASLIHYSDATSATNSALQRQLDAAIEKTTNAAVEIARLSERDTGLTEKLETQSAQFKDLQKQLTAEFENVATRILKANTAELAENSKKELGAVLDPLRLRIEDFEKKVELTYAAENREVLSLKEQIKLIVETTNSIGSHADGLAKALRGDSQLLGRWGELALERILEAAGLTDGREYISQGRGLGLRSDAGGPQRPDIVIMLPEQRTMIVDSKVPLASYERLVVAKAEDEREALADLFVRDVKGHIDDLAGKRYQENPNLQAHDCVLMFVPIEGALAAALTSEPDLFAYAWKKSVVLVGPSTLLMTMRTVASIWRYELQGQNAQEIARLAGDLCDKIGMSISDLNVVTEKIGGALDAHNEALKRLYTGKGNAASIGERIRNLGVKTKRPMPTVLVAGLTIRPESGEAEENATTPES